MSRIVKDPIYGYIRVDDPSAWRVIDSPLFQRLRHIAQTSYAPLFPSAVHNRFVHSLGVYRLGSFVADVIRDKSLPEDCKGAAKGFLHTFELACLLHDVGHAPFSHTGEAYYDLEIERADDADRKQSALNKELAKFLGVEAFNQKPAAQHEIMSALMAVDEFGDLIGDIENQRFLARAITGYTYENNPAGETRDVNGVPTDYLDCLISLLNGQVIDVDRLDYLLRDAYLTGFNTVTIDYRRLLTSIRIGIDNETSLYKVFFLQHAVGVLENCVYAHDAERKWIQCHPTIIYEGYLLSRAIESVLKEFFPDGYIPRSCLSDAGIELKKSGRSTGLLLKSLTDADMLFLMKNTASPEVVEYFSRGRWRAKLWKSEAEFYAYFNSSKLGGKNVDAALEGIYDVISALHKNYGGRLNDETLERFENEYVKESETNSKRSQHWLSVYRMENERKCGILRKFKKFANENDMPFDFLFLDKTAFQSGFIKAELSKLKIRFGDSNTMAELKDVTNVLTPQSGNMPSKVFYVFYIKDDPGARPSHDKISQFVFDLVRGYGA